MAKTDDIAAELRRSIIEGSLEPGSRLAEEPTAFRFGVSRVPVREALRMLETEGYIRLEPHRGAIVSRIDIVEAAELSQVHVVLEELIVQQAAEWRTTLDVAELRDIVGRGKAAVDACRWSELPSLNSEFHGRLATIAGNVTAARMADQLRAKIEWAYAVDAAARGERSWAEHAALVEAVEAGERATASTIIRQHVDRSVAGLRNGHGATELSPAWSWGQ